MFSSSGVVAALVIVATAVAAGGCGGTDGEERSAAEGAGPASSPTTAPASTLEPLTEQEFIAAADKICKQLDEDLDPVVARLRKLSESFASAPNEKTLDRRVRAVARLDREFAKVFETANEEIEALGPPSDPDLTRYLELRADYVPATLEIAAAYEGFAEVGQAEQADANKRVVAASKENQHLFDQLEGLAKDIGFKTCHRGED